MTTKAGQKENWRRIKTVQFAWPIGKPLVASLANGLWEIRVCLLSNRMARIIFLSMNLQWC